MVKFRDSETLYMGAKELSYCTLRAQVREGEPGRGKGRGQGDGQVREGGGKGGGEARHCTLGPKSCPTTH